jgi:hypothetical protein
MSVMLYYHTVLASRVRCEMDLGIFKSDTLHTVHILVMKYHCFNYIFYAELRVIEHPNATE